MRPTIQAVLPTGNELPQDGIDTPQPDANQLSLFGTDPSARDAPGAKNEAGSLRMAGGTPSERPRIDP